MEMFYGFKHPYYQEIEYRELLGRSRYPKAIDEFRRKNLTYKITNTGEKNQGGDFILEGKIKRQKMFASMGTDDTKMWQRVSRSLDDVTAVIEHINEMLHIYDTDGERHIDLWQEIIAWRALLRKSKYLKSYRNTETVYNFSGQKMSNDLIDLPSNLKQCMETYWTQFENGNTNVIAYISVTPGQELDDLLL